MSGSLQEDVCRIASMGPRREGRGNETTQEVREDVRVGFNGAASRRTRKPRREATGHGRLDCFNGAASRRTRKHKARSGLRSKSNMASMGPRREGRGNMPVKSLCITGARFNGAASRRTRKQLVHTTGSKPGRPLQWGRVAKDAETSSTANLCACSSACFNGAASRRTRKPRGGSDGQCRYRYHASMGPRREGRGNAGILKLTSSAPAGLQWGRVAKDAETPNHLRL